MIEKKMNLTNLYIKLHNLKANAIIEEKNYYIGTSQFIDIHVSTPANSDKKNLNWRLDSIIDVKLLGDYDFNINMVK